jgi:hypothetical protein
MSDYTPELFDYSKELTEKVWHEYRDLHLFEDIADLEFLQTSGRSVVRESMGRKASFAMYGGYIESTVIHSELVEIPRTVIGCTVRELKDVLFEDGKMDSIASLVVERLADSATNIVKGVQAELDDVKTLKVVYFGNLKSKNWLEVEDSGETFSRYEFRWEIGVLGIGR